MRVGGRAVAEHLGQDPGAAPAAWSSSSSTSTRGALGDDEAVAALVERAVLAPSGSSLRVDSARIAAKAPTNGSKTGASEPPAEHHLGVAAQDRLGRLADGVAGRGAGADRGEVGPARAERDGRLPGGHVGDGHRDEERRDAVRAARGVDRDLLDERARAAHAGADDGAGAVGKVALQLLGQAGLVHRLARGDERELGVAVVAPDLLAVEHAATGRSRTTSPAILLVTRSGSKRLDGAHAGLARTSARPERVDVVAQRRDRAHAGHDDAAGGSRDEPPRADRRGAIDVARQAALRRPRRRRHLRRRRVRKSSAVGWAMSTTSSSS